MPPSIEEEDPSSQAIKPTIGIIYPPPELRNIVDKTASFVARNGPEFEARIRQNEINNKKFNFLNIGDPYNAYYQHKVKEFKEGKGATEPSAAIPITTHKPAVSLPLEVIKAVEPPPIPQEPPAEFEFIVDPPSIAAIDLDIVKLTAQFVARNGRQFLTNLMNREQRNYRFDFLRPQHSLFHYFTKLLEQYTKILIPTKDLMNNLKRETDFHKMVYEQIKSRVEWIKHQEAIRRREEEEAERERVQYAQIDWHDFVVVETVDYQPNEQGLFPPPTTPNEVGSRVLALQRFDEDGDVEMEVVSDEEIGREAVEVPTKTMNISVPKPSRAHKPKENTYNIEMSMDEDMGRLAPSPPPLPPKEAPPLPPPLPPQPDHVVIRKDYNPKSSQKNMTSASGQYLISPITGEKIPAEKMQEHMRIGLLDPRWVEQRDKTLQEKVAQEEVYAVGPSIESSLKNFAERRTDIFGIGVEETAIGKKIGEEERRGPEKVTWDGHTASVEAATLKARANITIEEQIQQIHKAQGLLPDEEKERIGPSKPNISSMSHHTMTVISAPPKSQPPLPPAPRPPMPPPMPPGMPGMMPPSMMGPPQNILLPPPMMGLPGTLPFGPPMNMAMPDKMDDEPFSKRMKTEDNLIPEADFLSVNKSPVTFHVRIPMLADKPEWKLNGQMMLVSLSLTETVSAIKGVISKETGMPQGKQKLLLDGMFIKDSYSLAFYNVTSNSTVILQLKERGGRKK